MFPFSPPLLDVTVSGWPDLWSGSGFLMLSRDRIPGVLLEYTPPMRPSTELTATCCCSVIPLLAPFLSGLLDSGLSVDESGREDRLTYPDAFSSFVLGIGRLALECEISRELACRHSCSRQRFCLTYSRITWLRTWLELWDVEERLLLSMK
jgi:hypothetical protein